MKNNNFGKIILVACLVAIAGMGIWTIVSKSSSHPQIVPTEQELPTATAIHSDASPANPAQNTLTPNEGLILLVHQEAATKVSLINGHNWETFQISSDQIHFPDPVLSPEGTRIAFRDLDGYLSIYDVPTQETTTYTDAPMGGLYPFGWSPDGEKIVYGCPEAPVSICIFTLNTGDIKTFANMQDSPPNSLGGYTFAGWSCDGKKIGILYYEEPPAAGELSKSYDIGTIKMLNVDTEEITDVFSERDQPDIAHLQDAVLSPDGSSFLFSAMSGDYYAVYQVQADGSALTRITGEQYSYHIIHPVWQPDGQGFITIAPEQGEEPDQAKLVPTIFDLSGNIVSQIKVELGGIPTSWIGGVHLFSRE